MDTKMAPSCGNVFMERWFLKSLFNWPSGSYILCVWSSSRESLEAFLHRLNSYHPTKHFTWTISTESVEFLDIRIYKGSRFKETDILDV